MIFETAIIRKDFPILSRTINGKPLVYLDNAATTQKPRQVIDAIVEYYEHHNANVRRGVHTLADESTRLYEGARKTVADFIGASDPRELVFVRNTTEAINLVAYSWGQEHIHEGDEILLTEMEHHSNIVPWQLLADRQKAKLRFVQVDRNGRLNLRDFREKFSNRTKLVALAHVSNFLGTINPIREIAEIIRRTAYSLQLTAKKGAKSSQRSAVSSTPLFLVDGAQAVGHMPVDVKKLGCDFYCFSGHKMYGPMGIGCLWAKREILEQMQPFLTGGGMILHVTLDETTFADLPDRFDAGTPNVADAVGLSAAVKYLQRVGMENIRKHELELTRYALERLQATSYKLQVRIFGPLNAETRGGLVAFTLCLNDKEIHGHDVAQVLDSEGVEVRSGHHCTMPMHAKLGLAATTRVSFGVYNTKEEVDVLTRAIGKVAEVFR